MHELSIAVGILDIVDKNVYDPLKLRKVGITVTPLSGISMSSLEFCFNEVCNSKGYVNAVLEVTHIPVVMQCLQCDTKYECRVLDEFCPACNSQERMILSNSPFNVDYIDIED